MRRILASGATVLLALVLIAFAVANRGSVAVVVPTTQIAIDVPLYFVFFAGAIFGVLLAGLVTFWPRLRKNLQARRAERRAAAAQARVAELETTEPPEPPASLAAIDRAQDNADSAADHRPSTPARKTG